MTFIGHSTCMSASSHRHWNNLPLLIASDSAYISASALLSAVTGCLLLLQCTGAPFNSIIVPDWLRVVRCLSPPWSESEYTAILSGSPSTVPSILKSADPPMYPKTLIKARRDPSVGFWLYWPNLETACATSYLTMWDRYCIWPTAIL